MEIPLRLDIVANTLQQGPEKRKVLINRPVYREDDLQQLYCSDEKKEKPSALSNVSKRLKRTCSLSNILAVIVSLFPVISWLPKYRLKTDLVRDLSAGLTLGIIQIPQGMAYGMLTTLPAIYGLYVSFIPVFVYFVFGSSKHLNIGTFAIICLMVGEAVENNVAPFTTLKHSVNGTVTPAYDDAQIINLRVNYAVTVSFLVGILQVGFGFLRIGFITIFLSDPLISGFTTGAAFHVFSSQVKHLVGLQIPRDEVSGVLGLFKLYIYIFRNVTSVNYGAFIIGVVATVILLVVKYLAQKYKEKLKFPIPAELIVVVLGTGLSYGFHFNTKFEIPVLKSVPKGMPPLSFPLFSVMDSMVVDCLSIAIVSYAISVSIAKAFAKKQKYTIDANQELFAHGAVNIVSSFFSCTVASGSLSRSVIQESIGSTQLCTLFSCVLVFLTLVVLAPWFEPLPNSILAAIVLVALKGLFKQFTVLKTLIKISKVDAFVWVTSFVAVFCLGVDYGLAVGLVINLLTTVVRTSRPSTSSLGHVKETEIYTTITPDNELSLEQIPGVKIFQFHSPLLYINVDHFQEALFKATVDPADCVTVHVPKCYQKQNEAMSDNSEDILRTISTEKDTCTNTNSPDSIEERSSRKNSISQDFQSNMKDTSPLLNASTTPPCPLHTIILDCSQISYADTMGVGTLVSICSEFKNVEVEVLLCNTPDGLSKLLDLGGFIETHGSDNIFVSIHDAVQYSLASQHVSGVCESSMEKFHIDSSDPPLAVSVEIGLNDQGSTSIKENA